VKCIHLYSKKKELDAQPLMATTKGKFHSFQKAISLFIILASWSYQYCILLSFYCLWSCQKM